VNSKPFGPYAGWLGEGLSVDTAGRLRVLNFLTSHVYGPYWGWDPGAAGLSVRKPVSADVQGPDKNAADSMKRATISAPAPQ
jgi:hypothetical protein